MSIWDISSTVYELFFGDNVHERVKLCVRDGGQLFIYHRIVCEQLVFMVGKGDTRCETW